MTQHKTFNPQLLAERLHACRPVRRWLVGFSGGLDSTALLAALLAAAPEEPVIALHVNHGLSANAERWQSQVEALCRQWRIECRVHKVVVEAAGFGLEDAARQARYQIFESSMEKGDILLLGHHRDDQAETLVYRLMRGAGPRGLGSMVAERPLGPGRLVRPLLDFGKSALESYLNSQGIGWVSDESNQDENFDRNYLRQQIFPLLSRRWPHYSEQLRRSAEACQQADQLSRDLGRIDLAACDERRERWGWSLDWNAVKQLPSHRRDNLLRSWALEKQLPIMEHKHLLEARKQFFDPGQPSSLGAVQWATAVLRFYRRRLYLGSALPTPQKTAITWSPEQPLRLPDGSVLGAEQAHGGLHPSGPLEVRWRSGGERCQPSERAHSQTLKRLLQEYRLEPWLRDRVPLIYAEGRLAAVGDLWICKDFAAPPGESGYHFRWRWSETVGTPLERST